MQNEILRQLTNNEYLERTSWEQEDVRRGKNLSYFSESVIQDDWVKQALVQSVHLNSELTEAKYLAPFHEPASVFRGAFSIDVIDPISIIPNKDFYTDPPERILSVFASSSVRRGKKELFADYISEIKQKLYHYTRKANPVEFVLPTLPFKDQNPFTTRHSIDAVDLGEYLFFAQLRDITTAITETYPPGVRITLLTDGLVYKDLFANGQRNAIEEYRRNCQQIRDEMGLKGVIDIVDMECIVGKDADFYDIQQKMQERIQILSESDTTVALHIRSLAHGMRWNIPIHGHSYDEYRQMFEQNNLSQEITKQTYNTAVNYASFLLAMRRTRAIERAFPHAVRLTVHPKKAPQIPIHLVNNRSIIFPYNGVPVVSEKRMEETKNIRQSTKIMRFADVLDFPSAKAVYVADKAEPFYYQIDERSV